MEQNDLNNLQERPTSQQGPKNLSWWWPLFGGLTLASRKRVLCTCTLPEGGYLLLSRKPLWKQVLCANHCSITFMLSLKEKKNMHLHFFPSVATPVTHLSWHCLLTWGCHCFNKVAQFPAISCKIYYFSDIWTVPITVIPMSNDGNSYSWNLLLKTLHSFRNFPADLGKEMLDCKCCIWLVELVSRSAFGDHVNRWCAYRVLQRHPSVHTTVHTVTMQEAWHCSHISCDTL